MTRVAGVVAALVAGYACGSSQKAEPVVSTEQAPSADAGAPDAGPTLDEIRMAAIAKVMNESTALRHQCWAKAAVDDFRLDGKVLMEFGFDGQGAVSRAIVVTDGTKDRVLLDCLIALYEKYPWPPVFGETTPVRVPFRFTAPHAQYTIQRADVPVARPTKQLAVQVLLDARNTGNAAASMSWLALDGGVTVPMHRHTSAEVLYVAEGGGLMQGLGTKKAKSGAGVPVVAGSFVYVPAGVAHGFASAAPRTRLLQLYVPGGPEQRFKGGDQAGTTPVKSRRSRRRQPQPKVRDMASVPELAIAGGKGRVRIVFDKASAGDASAYAGHLTLDPGVKVPEHVHAGSTELLYLLEGSGVMTVAGTRYPVAAGTAIQIPPNARHAFEVTGGVPVVAVQFYTPSGPEQRFKESK